MVHYMLLHHVKEKKKHEMWFVVDDKHVCFGLKEFALIMSLSC